MALFLVIAKSSKFDHMKVLRYLLVLMLFASLTSCLEVIDDVSLKNDGSGTYKYTVNLSSSKVKINSLLALDSIDGHKVPTIDEIKQRINRVISTLESKPGISNVQMEANYDDYLFKLSLDFKSLDDLEDAIKTIVKEESVGKEIPELEHNFITMSANCLRRSVPVISIEKTNSIKASDRDLLKEGSYTSITRFTREIESFENENAKLSKNKMAIMLRTDPYSLTQNPQLLDNTIYLVGNNQSD